MRQVWVVLRREYLERVKTRGFIIGTLAIPLVLIVIMGVNIFIALQVAQSDRELVLVDLTAVMGEEVAERLEQVGYELELAGREADLEDLDRQVMEEEIEGYVVLDSVTLAEGVFAYRSIVPPGRTRVALFEAVVRDIALANYLSSASGAEGLRELIRGGQLEFESPLEVEEQEEAEVARVSGIAIGFGGVMVLYITMLLYGAFVLRSVLDEKRNRVVEVVVSSISPWRLLLGKVLGVGSMGLTQMGIWAGCAILLLLVAAPMVASQIPAADLSELTGFLPGPGVLVLLLVFFLLGYFLYSSLFAAVGAMCATEEEAGQAH